MALDHNFMFFGKLPSKGLYYPPEHPLHNKSSIPLKPMRVKDEALLLNPYLRKTKKSDEEILRSLTGIEDLDVFNLLAGDVAGLFFSIFISNYEYQMEQKIQCSFCEEKNDCIIMVDTFPVRTCDYPSDEPFSNRFTIMLPRLGAAVTLKFPTHGELLAATGDVENQTTSLLRAYIASVNGNENPASLDRFVTAINLQDVSYIRKFMNMNEPGVISKYKFFCQNQSCQKENVLNFAYGSEMFGVGPENIEEAYLKPAWLLSYMSGEPLDKTVEWPVAVRRWWIKEIENDIKARAERKEDIPDKHPIHNSPDIREMLGKERLHTPNAKMQRFT